MTASGFHMNLEANFAGGIRHHPVVTRRKNRPPLKQTAKNALYARLLSSVLLVLVAAIGIGMPASATDFIVKPGELAGALLSVLPGDRVLLQGVHTGFFTMSKGGTAEAPVVITSAPGQLGVIDRASATGDNTPALRVYAPYVRLEGFRITNSDPNRTKLSPVSGVEEPWRGAGINGKADHLSVRNMIIDNCGHGILCHQGGLELYGNLFLFNGNNNLEHGFYGGANGANIENRIEDNIFIGNAGDNIHISPQNSLDPVQNFWIAGNVCVAAAMIGARERTSVNLKVTGRYTPLFDNITIEDNYVYVPASYPSAAQNGIEAGRESALNQRLSLLRNLVYADKPLLLTLWTDLISEGNLFLSGSEPSAQQTYIQVRPNRYLPGHANIAVWNRSQQATVGVDLSAVLSPDDTYEVIDAFNPLGAPVASGVWDGTTPVRLPMTGLAVPATVGNPTTPASHTAPQFGVFLVRRSTQSAPAPTSDTTAPTVQITQTVVGSLSVTVKVNATDNIGVTKVELYADGVLADTETAAPYTLVWDTSQVKGKSSHTLTVKAYDAAGNVGVDSKQVKL